MSIITLNFFGEEVLIDIPENLLNLRKKISLLFRLNLEDSQELILTYKDNNSKISHIENDEDYRTFLSQKRLKISTEISPNSKLYKSEVEKRDKDEEIEKDKKQLQELIELDNEMEKPTPDKFKAENDELKEINEKISKLNKRKNELIKKINSSMEEKNKKHLEVKQKIAELQEKLGLPQKEQFDKRLDPFRVKENRKPINQINRNSKDKIKKDKPDKEDNKKPLSENPINLVEKEDFYMDKNKNELNKKEKETKKYLIEYICDSCEKPIFGIRYNCTVCDDFDFCEKCEEKYGFQHGHPLLKIKDPRDAPVKYKCLLREN